MHNVVSNCYPVGDGPDAKVLFPYWFLIDQQRCQRPVAGWKERGRTSGSPQVGYEKQGRKGD